MKFSKKSLIMVLALVVVMALTTVVNAGAGYQADLWWFLAKEEHVILGKTYKATAEQEKVIEDYLMGADCKDYSDDRTMAAIDLLKEAIQMINSTGATSFVEVSTDIKAQALSKIQQAAAKVDVTLNVNTSTGAYSAVSDGKTLYSGVLSVSTTGGLDVIGSATAADNTYVLLEGKDQIYNIASCTDLTFRWNVDYSLFSNGGKVYVDDKLVDPSCYTSKSGSTIVSLKYSYLKTLNDGNHTIKVEYNNGKISTAAFVVTNGSGIISAPGSANSATQAANSGKTFVYTGSNNVAYIVLSLLAVVAVSTVFVKKVYVK